MNIVKDIFSKLKLRNLIGIAIFIYILCFPSISINAAEVLQVRNFKLLQIGDQNRSYTVQIACIEVYPSKEKSATNWLKSNLPRNTKVNLRPLSSEDGVLLARVIPLGSKLGLNDQLVLEGFGSNSCND